MATERDIDISLKEISHTYLSSQIPPTLPSTEGKCVVDIPSEDVFYVLYTRRPLLSEPRDFEAQGAGPLPLPLRVAKAGRNHLNEEITPLLPIGDR